MKRTWDESAIEYGTLTTLSQIKPGDYFVHHSTGENDVNVFIGMLPPTLGDGWFYFYYHRVGSMTDPRVIQFPKHTALAVIDKEWVEKL